MRQIEATARKWGNSLGIILPKEAVQKNNIKENDKIEIFILKQDDTLQRTFGMFKGKIKKNTQQIKDEIRKELYND